MTTDNRTPAEIAYDAARLSPAPIVQPDNDPMTPDPNIDQIIAVFERLEAQPAAPDALTRIFEFIEDEPLSANDDLLIAARWLDSQMPAVPADTPIGTLPTGETIRGSWDHTGRTGIVNATIAGEYVNADDTLTLSASWENVSFEGATRADLAKARQILDAADWLFEAAEQWADERIPIEAITVAPAPAKRPTGSVAWVTFLLDHKDDLDLIGATLDALAGRAPTA